MSERVRLPVAVHILLRRGNKLLLMERRNTPYYAGSWGVPSGHIEGNEPAHTAAVRECREEVGITPDKLELVHVVHHGPEGEGNEYLHLFFAATRWTGEPGIAEPDKCSRLMWAGSDDTPPNIVPELRAALSDPDNLYMAINFPSE